MGIRGLFTYIQNYVDSALEWHQLHNCRLVIDGNNLAYEIYNNGSKLNSAYGGDYDKYAIYVEEFFTKLLECKVEPFIIMDGGHPMQRNKFATAFVRMKDQTYTCMSVKPENNHFLKIFPILGRSVFVNVIRKLGISVLQCDFEADDDIVVIAKRLNAYVLSNDSDFYLFNVPFILLNSMNLNRVQNVKRDDGTSYKFIPCYKFNAKIFAQITNVEEELIPVLAPILGNDCMQTGWMRAFHHHIASLRPSSKTISSRHKLIMSVIRWLGTQKDGPDDVLEKIFEVRANSFDNHKKKLLKNGLCMYFPKRSTLLPWVSPHDDSCPASAADTSSTQESELEEDSFLSKVKRELSCSCSERLLTHIIHGGQLPDWFVRAFRLQLVHPVIPDILNKEYFFSFPQVEVLKLKSVYLNLEQVVLNIRRILWYTLYQCFKLEQPLVPRPLIPPALEVVPLENDGGFFLSNLEKFGDEETEHLLEKPNLRILLFSNSLAVDDKKEGQGKDKSNLTEGSALNLETCNDHTTKSSENENELVKLDHTPEYFQNEHIRDFSSGANLENEGKCSTIDRNLEECLVENESSATVNDSATLSPLSSLESLKSEEKTFTNNLAVEDSPHDKFMNIQNIKNDEKNIKNELGEDNTEDEEDILSISDFSSEGDLVSENEDGAENEDKCDTNGISDENNLKHGSETSKFDFSIGRDPDEQKIHSPISDKDIDKDYKLRSRKENVNVKDFIKSGVMPATRWYIRKGHDVWGKELRKEHVDKFDPKFSLFDIENMTTQEKKAAFYKMSGIEIKFSENIPQNLEFILYCVCFWRKTYEKKIVDFQSILATLMCVIMFHVVDRGTGRVRDKRTFDTIDTHLKMIRAKLKNGKLADPSKLTTRELLESITEEECQLANLSLFQFHEIDKSETKKTYDRLAVHAFSGYQATIYYLQIVNSLLRFPFPNTSVESFWSGTFSYNVRKCFCCSTLPLESILNTIFRGNVRIIHLFLRCYELVQKELDLPPFTNIEKIEETLPQKKILYRRMRKLNLKNPSEMGIVTRKRKKRASPTIGENGADTKAEWEPPEEVTEEEMAMMASNKYSLLLLS